MDKTTPMQSKPLVDVTCKLGAKGCFEDGRCHALGNCENKITTNADRIRAMNDEELSEVMEELTYDAMEHNSRYWLEWLQQPVKEDA